MSNSRSRIGITSKSRLTVAASFDLAHSIEISAGVSGVFSAQTSKPLQLSVSCGATALSAGFGYGVLPPPLESTQTLRVTGGAADTVAVTWLQFNSYNDLGGASDYQAPGDAVTIGSVDW